LIASFLQTGEGLWVAGQAILSLIINLLKTLSDMPVSEK
jgi:hypothetical protein